LRRLRLLSSDDAAISIRWCAFRKLAPIFLALSFYTTPVPADEPAELKRVEVDKTHQVLRAYQGNRLVLETRISTGRWDRSTPNGQYSAGDKFLMHYSKLYHHAPMPYSIQINGNVFIHGFTSVPRYPASHGCIRVPLDGDNPAKRFYDWVEPGTPVEIGGRWEGK
jgi:lipoprotein-anchoring transpeptidase ErfK/SrfK